MAARAAVVMLLALVAVAAAAASAAAIGEDRVFLERLLDGRVAHALPLGWRVGDHAQGSALVTLSIAVKHHDAAALEERFWAVSEPDSSEYGQHATLDELERLTAPSASRLHAVTAWLQRDGGISADEHCRRVGGGAWLVCTVPAAAAERLLQTTIHWHHHDRTGRVWPRALDGVYSVAADVAEHLDFVGGLTRLPKHSSDRRVAPAAVQQQQAAASYSPYNSTRPVVASFHAGAGQATLFFMPVCADQTVPQGGSLATACDGGASGFGSFQLEFQPAANMASAGGATLQYQLGGNESSASAQLQCGPCQSLPGMYPSDCEAMAANNSLWCLAAVGGLDNYVLYSYQLRSVYTGGAQSDVTSPALPVASYPFMLPRNLAQLYNIPPSAQGTAGGNSMSVGEFLEQYINVTDLQLFLQRTGVNQAPALSEPIIIGENIDTLPGGEASLDIQYIVGVAPNVRTYFMSFSGRYNGSNPPQEPFLDFVQKINSMPDPPLVHSLSYDDQEYSLPGSYMARLNQEFQKAGTRGLSLFFASGDDGVCGFDGRTNFSVCAQNNPTFPGSSPYVTSIGGTQLSLLTSPSCLDRNVLLQFGCTPAEAVSSIATGSRITGGGGVSNFNARPAYQADFAQSYLDALPAAGGPPTSVFNTTGRMYPDISSQAHNYVVYMDGIPYAIDGTSASTPVIAAMVALLNDARLRTHQKPLGFINPWMYRLAKTQPEVFVDITYGENGCTANTFQQCSPYGFPAVPGYDASSGLGVWNFAALRNIVLNPDLVYANTVPSQRGIQKVVNKRALPVAISWFSLAGAIAGSIALITVLFLIAGMAITGGVFGCRKGEYRLIQ